MAAHNERRRNDAATAPRAAASTGPLGRREEQAREEQAPTMQFTPQQLAGAQRYTQRTRVGNWLEDMCLEEEKLSEFSRSQENGSLIMNDLYKKQAVYNKRVALSKCADGALRFGDKVMIGNPAAGALLAVDLTESIFESDQGSRLVTASFANMPVARAVFVVLPTDKSAAAPGDVVHFGEPFHLQCHDVLLRARLEHLVEVALELERRVDGFVVVLRLAPHEGAREQLLLIGHLRSLERLLVRVELLHLSAHLRLGKFPEEHSVRTLGELRRVLEDGMVFDHRGERLVQLE